MSETRSVLKIVAIGALSLMVFALLYGGEYTAAGVWFIALVLIGSEDDDE